MRSKKTKKVTVTFLAVIALAFWGCANDTTEKTVAVTGVSLDKTELALTVGGEETLKVTVTPAKASNKKVKWESSAPAIAAVDADGKVEAKAVGTATITVTTVSGKKKATCEVTVSTVITGAAVPGVTAPAVGAVPVTAVETPHYTGTVTWEPDDNPFKGGTVYTATITLTAKNGFTLKGVAENSFTVEGAETVTHDADSGTITAVFPPTPVLVTGVTLDKPSLGLTVYGVTGADTGTLTATVEPSDATDKGIKSWESSDDAIATVDGNGKVQAKAGGTATITVTTAGLKADWKPATATRTVTVTVLVKDVKLNKKTLGLVFKEEETLTAEVNPDGATATVTGVTWESDTPAVATVDEKSGLVTAVSGGTAVITVTTAGFKADGKPATETCSVKVGYGVSFDSNGGSEVPRQIIDLDGKVEEPPEPTRVKYKFDGWYKEDLKTPWVFDTDTVTATITLYAKWLPNTLITVIDFAAIVDEAPVLEDITIYRSSSNGQTSATITLSYPEQYTGYEWYFNNILLSEDATVTLDSGDIRYNTIGIKRLTLEVVKDGILYSTSISFTVKN